jgi:integrase/recombinase XerC
MDQVPERRYELAKLREDVSVRELVQAWRSKYRGNTLKAYERDLRHFAKFMRLDSLDEVAEAISSSHQGKANLFAERWKAHLVSQGLAPKTINRRLAALRSFVHLMNKLGLVPWELNVDSVPDETRRETRGPAVAEVKKILDLLDTDPDTPITRRSNALVYLLFSMALRAFEATGLDMEHLFLEEGYAMVLGKGRAERERVTVPPYARKALRRWIAARGDYPGPVFVNFDPAGKGTGRLTEKSVHRIVAKLGRRVGIPRLHPHALRHSGITVALDAFDGDMRTVVRFSRHKKIDTLETYDDKRRDPAGQIAHEVDKALGERAKKRGENDEDEGGDEE